MLSRVCALDKAPGWSVCRHDYERSCFYLLYDVTAWPYLLSLCCDTELLSLTVLPGQLPAVRAALFPLRVVSSFHLTTLWTFLPSQD